MERIAWPTSVLVGALTICPLTHGNMNSLLCVQIPCNLESIAAFVAVFPALGPMQQQDHQVSVMIHCGFAHAWHSTRGRDVQLWVDNISPNPRSWKVTYETTASEGKVSSVTQGNRSCVCKTATLLATAAYVGSILQFVLFTSHLVLCFWKDIQSAFFFYPPVLIQLYKFKKTQLQSNPLDTGHLRTG